MASRIVGIDIGSYSVKAAILEPRGKGFEVLGYSEELVPGGEEPLRDRQSAALGTLKARGGLAGDLYVVAVGGDLVATRTLLFPFSDKAKVAEALPFLLESEIALDIDDVVYSWHILPQRPTPEGKRKETEVACAYVRRDVIQEMLNLLAEHGVDPRHVEVDAFALQAVWAALLKTSHDTTHEGPSSLRTPGGTVIELGDGAPAPAVALVDIGHRHTSVCIVEGDRVVSVAHVLHGGLDATRALAKELGLTLAEAERGKRKEAFIEVQGAVAQFPEQQQISDTLKRAYAPVVRRLRQVFQATVSSSRLRVVRIMLSGGGSRILNLDRHLAAELNVKVVRARELATALRGRLPTDPMGGVAEEHLGAEAAAAFGLALAGLPSQRTGARFDFRVGPFAWRGDFDFLRERAVALGGWAAAILLTVAVGASAQLYALAKEDDRLYAQQLAMCEQITGQRVDSTSRCIALIQEKINGTSGFQIPEHSALDTFVEISRRLPYANELKRKVMELDISSERVRMKGTTETYESIDTMVERLQGGKCFSLVEKGKARNVTADAVEFNITMTLDCVAAPGDGRTFPAPPGPTAASYQPKPSATPALAATPAVAKPAMDMKTTTVEPREGDDGTGVIKTNKNSPEELEARRERLRKLREERSLRRKQMLENPVARPGIRDRFERMPLPVGASIDQGDE